MKVIECPRDAMQGLHKMIPTKSKIQYINQLLKVGFDTIDFGSFVSPKAIPQMQDTAEVLASLHVEESNSKLLAIIANTRGAMEAAVHKEITCLGFPLSISETFQIRNTNKTIPEAFQVLYEIQDICLAHKKILVVYISMAFGNPYGDPYSMDKVVEFIEKLQGMDVQTVSLADTIGISDPENITKLFEHVIPAFPTIEFGAHLHSPFDASKEKIISAYQAGCRRFDSTVKGYGGCPMAKDELVGNIPTEIVLDFVNEHKIDINLNQEAFRKALQIASDIFPLD